METVLVRLCLLILCLSLPFTVSAGLRSAAFYYGPDIPWNELAVFDLPVVEAAQSDAPPPRLVGQFYAYVSLGEVLPSRDYAPGIKPEWVLGENRDWRSRVLDLANPELRRYLIEEVIAPLWAQGYRKFFFDTLDSYRLVDGTSGELDAQREGLRTLINAIAEAFPGARFILNRGFELLPAVHKHVDAVAAESLYQRWVPAERRYQPVPEDDRQWLLDRFEEVRDRYGLSTIAIDYAPPDDRSGARAIAKRIQAQGVIPWVSNPSLDMLGVGRIEVMPRRVLAIHGEPKGSPWEQSELVRFALMPMQFLGLVPDIRDVGDPMPEGTLNGRYAGIVTWINEPERVSGRFQKWLASQVANGVPVAILGQMPLDARDPVSKPFGLQARPVPRTLPRVVKQHPAMAFEAPLPALLEIAAPLTSESGESWLRLAAGDNEYTPVAVTAWGGYALDPFVVRSTLPTITSEETTDRWMIQPLTFLRAALKLPAIPVPDVTTENGRRLFFAHMDGDGFPNLAEVEGYRGQAAGEVLLQEILKRYRVPTTISVVEGEVAKTGLYPERAGELEDIAQRMFELPHVEAATHTYSHPFYWREATQKPGAILGSEGALRLNIPDYELDLQRELGGSADYIKKRLLPPGKDVEMVLWSGDTRPTERALEVARQNGLLNMNGSDTLITESAPSWTLIKGIGLPKGDEYQVFAPNQNENVYTGEWRGPFYGFQRVIETYKLTGEPIRFKPIDVYYHTYIASKNASLTSLRRVFDWVLSQPVHAVFASEYIRKVLDFNRMVVARDGDGWLIQGGGELRTLRVPPGVSLPDLLLSSGIAGYQKGGPGPYVHMSGDTAYWRSGDADAGAGLWSANARLTAFEREGSNLRFSLRGHLPLSFTLMQPPGCVLRQGEKVIQPARRDGRLHQYRSDRRGLDELRLQCRQ